MPSGVYTHKPCSKETKEKIRKALEGKHHSKEHIRRIVETKKQKA